MHRTLAMPVCTSGDFPFNNKRSRISRRYPATAMQRDPRSQGVAVCCGAWKRFDLVQDRLLPT